MLRSLASLPVGGLLAATASAASFCSGARFLDPATDTCQPCVGRTVKTCSSATVATSCVSRYYLTSDGRCVPNGQCPDATFVDKTTGTCANCYSPNYKTCSSAAATAATSCMENSCLPATGGRCLPLARIASTSYCTSARTVSSCSGIGVKTCTVDGKTLTCASPYFFDAAAATTASASAAARMHRKRISTVSPTASCVLEPDCPTGTFADEASRTCAACGEGVSRCTAAGAEQCYDGWYLLDKKCYKPCPDGYEGKDGVCVKASSNPCDAPLFYNAAEDSCKAQCTTSWWSYLGVDYPGTYPDVENRLCLPCKGNNVYMCDQETGIATKCQVGFYWDNADHLSCQPCKDPRAFVCDAETGLATSCRGEAYVYEGTCVDTCPTGYEKNDINCVPKTCNAPQFYDPASDSCAASCPSTGSQDSTGALISPTYPDLTTRRCVVCKAENAWQCDQESGLATECNDGYVLSEGYCLTSCPQGQKALLGVCVDQSYCPDGLVYEPYTQQCGEGCYDATEMDGIAIPAEYISEDGKTCLVCKSANTQQCNQLTGLAVSCIDGYYLLDGQCYATCPEGYKVDGASCVKDTAALPASYIGCATYAAILDAGLSYSYLDVRQYSPTGDAKVTIANCLAACKVRASSLPSGAEGIGCSIYRGNICGTLSCATGASNSLSALSLLDNDSCAFGCLDEPSKYGCGGSFDQSIYTLP